MNQPSDGLAEAGRRPSEGTALQEQKAPSVQPAQSALKAGALVAGGVLLSVGSFWLVNRSRPRPPRGRLSKRAASQRTGLNIALGSMAAAASASLALSIAGLLPQIVGSQERPHSLQGADARAPTAIPPAGWWDITRRTYGEISRDRVLAVSAGVTFYAVLALFPALTAFVSLYGLFADTATVGAHLAMLQGLLPEGALTFVGGEVTRIAASNETTLGLAFIAALLLSLWSANSGVKALIEALNVAYGEEEKRGFIRLNLISLGFTAGLLAFVLLALAGIAGVPVLLDWLYLGDRAEWIIWLGRWPALLLVLVFGLSMLYRFGPSRNNPQWRWVSPGALFASLAWLVGSLLFSWYVANFANYNATYGTLGALMALLMWIWLSATIIVLGAEINSETERQTFRDTTVGPPAPIGLRGAEAADNKLGEKNRDQE